MIVYILTIGHRHEQGAIEGVFSDRDSAEAEGERLVGNDTSKCYDVTEYDLQ